MTLFTENHLISYRPGGRKSVFWYTQFEKIDSICDECFNNTLMIRASTAFLFHKQKPKGEFDKKGKRNKKGQNEREREREREKERERERGRESGMETVIDLLPSPGSCHYFQLTPTFSGDFLLFIFRGFVFFRFSFSFGRCPAPTAPVYFAAAGRLSHAAEKNRVPVSKIGSTKTKTKRHR